jgi:hypothetical protein
MRIMSIRWANVTDKAAVTGAVTAGTGEVDFVLATADLDALVGAIFAASVQCEAATGVPATVVAMATDAYLKFGPAIAKLTAPADNTARAGSSAATLQVDLSGLSITHTPGAAPGTILVTNNEACRWAEDGPRTLDAAAVQTLGREVAIYGFAGLADLIPAGIVKLHDVAAAAATKSRKG